MKEIRVLGTGCAKCKQLYAKIKQQAGELNIEANIIKDEDIASIMSFNVTNIPAIVLDGKVVSSGKLLSDKEINEILTKS